jgi:tyrosyl-tRNA synthetase
MSKVITDEKLIDEVLERGVEQIFPDKAALKKKLMSGERISLYCGFDPSAPALHIGNAIQLNKLRQFQELGHDVIFLIGDFTGMIGDPTDKAVARKTMTREELLENSKEYQKQASGYLKFDGDNPARVLYNSQWSDKLSFNDIIKLASNFTAQQTLARDMFKKRIADGKDLFLHEFLYPMMQAYDSVAMDVDLEIGGNDQMFNMLAGRTLMKKMKNKEKFVMTTKLLTDENGKKMGKTEGNVVWLNQEPEDMYGAVMSWADGAIAIGLELATALPMIEVEKIKQALSDEKNNPRDYKIKLAYEMVKINHGEKAAERAQEDFVSKFQKRDVTVDVPAIEIKISANLVEILMENKLAQSHADAKRKISQGGISIDGVKIDINTKITPEMNGKILKVGKKDFRKIKVE